MVRLVRAVFSGIPHHVAQRGNGRAQTFFSDEDYGLYRDQPGSGRGGYLKPHATRLTREE